MKKIRNKICFLINNPWCWVTQGLDQICLTKIRLAVQTQNVRIIAMSDNFFFNNITIENIFAPMYAERRGEIPTKIQKIRMTIKFVSFANVTVKSFKITSIFDKYHHRLHKYHNAPDLYSAIHHFVTEHYGDVIMGTIASQITSLTIVYSTVYSGADQRKTSKLRDTGFVWGIHRDRWIPRTNGQ